MEPKDLYVTSRCTVASFSQGKDLAIIGDATQKTATPEEFALAKLFADAPDLLAERDALRAQVASLAAALRQYADPMNWGYRDESGYPKGYGEYEDACFIGRDVAVAAIAAAEGGTK